MFYYSFLGGITSEIIVNFCPEEEAERRISALPEQTRGEMQSKGIVKKDWIIKVKESEEIPGWILTNYEHLQRNISYSWQQTFPTGKTVIEVLEPFICPIPRTKISLFPSQETAHCSPALNKRNTLRCSKQAGFLESLWTQVLILQFLRTSKVSFLQSRPSAPVIVITLAGVVVFTWLTFTKAGTALGLTQMPGWYFIFLLVISVLYMLLATVMKQFYPQKYKELI